MLSLVSVPVLSIQSTSMLPKLCMALISLIMVCFLLIARLPLARQAVITIGSISGIRPTATDRAKAKDSIHFPSVIPSNINTMGTNIAMKRIITQAMESAPFLKEFLSSESGLVNLPYRVSLPTANTMPSPFPLITVVAIKARFSS